MRYLLLVPVLTSLFVLGCSPEKAQNANPDPEIPQEIAFKIQPQKVLTDKSRTKLMNLINLGSENDLLLKTVDSLLDGYGSNEDRKTQLSEEAKNLLTKLSTQCSIFRETPVSSTSGSGQKGDVINYTNKSTVSGANCPISAVTKSGGKFVITQMIDKSKSYFRADYDMDYSRDLEVKPTSKTELVLQNSRLKGSGKYVNREGMMVTYLKGPMGMTYSQGKTRVSVSGNLEALTRMPSEGSSQFQFFMNGNIETAEGVYALDMMLSNDRGMQLYIDGNLMPAEFTSKVMGGKDLFRLN